jgi:large repetitive protein
MNANRRHGSSLGWLTGLCITIAAISSVWVSAHSVGQVQTTKFFAPETVNLLVSRAATGTPGFVVGDTINYIIEFTPVSNSATIGAGGYITDYIPTGTEVVGAWMVQPGGTSGYTPIAPDLPGPMSNGWGASAGQRAFDTDWSNLAVLNAAGNTTKAACVAAGYTLASCNGSLAQIYADTGIFYSTNSRTAVFTSPSTDGRVRQGCTTNTPAGNGYNVATLRGTQLNPIIGQSCATTHNLWDADQANAFGSVQTTIDPMASPKSAAPSIGTGQGATPYNAGSAVAGPDSGYKLDNTGNVGPWQRISYSGSRIGNPTGPATTTTSSNTSTGVVNSSTAIVGQTTSAGWSLSPANPLPASTNSVRWAVGQLVVGQLKYVKISLRLTAPLPPAGMINNSEVFGGDSARAAGEVDRDNPWTYHVPSVADNTTNLFVVKTIKCVFSGATCVPSDGSNVPANAKIRYSITYLNSSNGTQTNLVLSDTLPCQTAANSVKLVNVVSGFAFGTTLPTTAAGVCSTTSNTGDTFSFATIPSLNAGQGGTVEVDVQTNAALGNVISNRARLVSTQVPAPGSVSNVASSVVNTANVQINKTTSTPNISPNGTATYTISISNSSAAAASNIVVTDFLPTIGGTTAGERFTFVAGSSSFSGPTVVTPTTASPPTIAPFTSQNRQEVTWNFGSQTLAVGSTWTITFNATAGASVPASTTPYLTEGCAWSRQQIHRLLQFSSRTTQPHVEQHQQAVRHHRQIAQRPHIQQALHWQTL